MTADEKAERIELVHSGEDYFQRLKALIAGAGEVIHAQVYILSWDDTGREVVDWLIEAAQRKVRVYLLVDHFGSSKLPGAAIKRIRRSGIRFRFFAPPFSLERLAFGRTLHHKIVVADERVALIGGINFADRYRFGADGKRVWLDFAVEIEGAICRQPHLVCQRLFNKKSAPKRLKPGHLGRLQIRWLRNDWLRRQNEISRHYREAVSRAESSITMAMSYFLPEKSFRRLLAQAVARGVEVRIMLSGPSDMPLSRLAEHYLHRYLLGKGIRLFEWRPSVLHAKVMAVDGQSASVGSYNLNHLSHFRSIEFNVEINDRLFAGRLEAHLLELMDRDCTEITPDNAPTLNSRWHRFKSWLAYSIHRTLVIWYMSRKAYES